MVTPDNPAGRLHIILSKAAGLNKGGSNDLRLAELFEIPGERSEEARLEVFHRLIELLKLVDETTEALNNIKTPDLKLYLRPFPHIRQTILGIMGHLYGNWDSYRQNIAGIDFGALEFCSTKLSEYPTEQPIQQADFDVILKDVQDLFDDVNREGMPPDLRLFILDLVESIRRAIAEYRIRGAERLREELGEIIGAIYINYHIVEAVENKPQITKVWKIFNTLKEWVGFANAAKPLAEPFIKGWLGDHTPPS